MIVQATSKRERKRQRREAILIETEQQAREWLVVQVALGAVTAATAAAALKGLKFTASHQRYRVPKELELCRFGLGNGPVSPAAAEGIEKHPPEYRAFSWKLWDEVLYQARVEAKRYSKWLANRKRLEANG
jgi:hypothetical protein